jgi:hypothetical protein
MKVIPETHLETKIGYLRFDCSWFFHIWIHIIISYNLFLRFPVGFRGRVRMVVGFTPTFAISA